MFDIATRPTPPVAGTPVGLLGGVPFDWRLTPPLPAAPLPHTDYATGAPQAGAEVLKTFALACDDTLQTAIILSLFTDRRAGPDDRLPWGSDDRRGWMGDAYVSEAVDVRQDAWGSTLWLLYVGKVASEVLPRARLAVQEALAWLVRDGVATRVQADAEWHGDVLAVRPQIWQGQRAQPIYDVLWATTVRRGMGANA